jgi:signal transduction histidine kinase/ligand-binding sensor domain-containing protein/DNA-binding response OmpR family regulator
MNKSVLLTTTTLLITTVLLTGQGITSRFCQVEREELSNKSVACILKDSRGFMWFGSTQGLCRYDGTSVVVYKHDPFNPTSLIHNDINALHEDREQRIWVGTANGVSLYVPRHDSFVNIDSIKRNKNHLSNAFVTAIASDHRGRIWIGTAGSGINVYDPAEARFHYLLAENQVNKYVPYSYISTITIEGTLAWIGTRGGLRVIDTENMNDAALAFAGTSAISKEVTAMIRETQDKIIVGFADGAIRRLQQKDGKVAIDEIFNIDATTGGTSTVRDLKTDGRGVLWITTEKSGLLSFDMITRNLVHLLPEEGNPFSAPTPSFRSLYVDENRRIWLGTYNMGVYFIDPGMSKFELYQRNPLNKYSLPGNIIRSFAEASDGTIWVAGSGGVSKFDPRLKRVSPLRHINDKLRSTLAKTIIVDSRERIWIGLRDEGVIRMDHKNTDKNYDLISDGIGNNKVMCLFQDSRKTIWAGTLGSGLFYYDEVRDQFVPLVEQDKKNHVPARAYVSAIAEDADGSLWIGTLYGLFNIAPQSEGVHQYHYRLFLPDGARGISSSRIVTIHRDRDSTMWFGSFDNGLNKLISKKDGHFHVYTERDGLVSNSVTGITNDMQGNLWICTNSGISRFNQRNNSFRNFSKSDGLNSNNFFPNAVLRTSTGKLLFGGDNGFSFFHPDSIAEKRTPPEIHLTKLKINNQEALIGQTGSPLEKHISMTEKIALSAEQRSFTIEFVALDYGISSRNQYCYKLQGFDKDWNCAGPQHTATYTNIDPGDYIFLVKGSNSDGVWSTAPARLAITIHPPLSKTWWAKLLYVTGFMLLLYFAFRIRTAQMRIRNQLKLEKVAREKEHELTEYKTNFFTNISHELRTPLSLIVAPLEKLVGSEEISSETKSTISTAHRNATNLARLVDELMDFSRLDEVKPTLRVHYVEVVRLVTEISANFSGASDKKKIRLSIESSTPEIMAWLDTDKVEKIITNLLSNAFKFTGENGAIKISMTTCRGKAEMTYIEVVVADNGIGIAPQELPLIFEKFYQAKSAAAMALRGTGIGLSLTRSLVHAHRGTISADSQPGIGTTFTVRLPIERSAYLDLEIVDQQDQNLSIATADASTEDLQIVPGLDGVTPQLLIIEDNKELCDYLVREFQADFIVSHADNGHDGIRLAQERIPDLIISDVLMPGRDGISLCKEIKSDVRTSHIPVILLTAKASTEDHVTGIDNGADIYVSKPFSLQVLRSHVRQIIHARRNLYARFSQEAYLMPAGLADNNLDKEFLQTAINYVEKNLLNTQLSVESLAALYNVSRSQVYRKIKALTGHSAVEFIRTIRLKKALKLMEEKRLTLSEIAYRTGFNSLSYFTRSFKDQYGKAPSEYLAGKKVSNEVNES